ncbi:oligosaccharide flippase family protein [Flavobacterium sp. TP390]|uniref:Oligosaccharide flippase family protein n=1 Tax=Flavobacterium profundi TaxID=1774945 RepID=A0A6I4IGV0_9FLAO|nr:oligosaccharide flippase family protein [Flavobacterium profundi]MVO08923.1 oligosaccharide flippase family protein [Flavobacterium profundi]
MFTFILKIVKEDNFLSLMGNLILAGLGFAGFALLARSLDTVHFAQWVIFISGGSLVEMLRFGITNNALVRFLSGASKEYSEQLIGSNVRISFIVTFWMALLLFLIYFLFNETISNSVYALFFTWYPVLAFVNLPWNNAMVVLQAKRNYDKMLWIKTLNSGLFFVFLVLNIWIFKASLLDLILVLIGVNLLTSLLCMYKGWDGIVLFKKATKATNKVLLNFGKYSTFTLIGTNLLRNADLLIISISPLGSAAVAMFSIPLKLTELQQIPLRSFAATAFPKMSKASLEKKQSELKSLFYTYSGALTYFFFLLSLITFVFAEYFILLVSGNQYLEGNPTSFNMITLVRIFSIYGVLLPIDRMTGIGLDSINKPNINALKVVFMLVTNVIGDLIAVFVFQSLEWVALSTLAFTTVGILLGAYFMNKEFNFSFLEIFKSGNRFYLSLWKQLISLNNTRKLIKNQV